MQNLSVSKTEEVPVKTKVYRGKDKVYILGLSCHAICVTPTLCPISCFFKVNVNALAQWWLFGARKFLLALLPRGTVMFVLLLCWNKNICLSKFVFVSYKRNKRSQLFIWHCFVCAYESFSNIELQSIVMLGVLLPALFVAFVAVSASDEEEAYVSNFAQSSKLLHWTTFDASLKLTVFPKILT